jgi:hypothetical protein
MDLPILAQVPEIATPTTIIGAFIAVTLSVTAVLVWVLRHVFLTTIPAIQAQHDKSRELFTVTVKAVQDKALADAEADRKASQATIDKLCTTFQAEARSERDLCQEQFRLINTSLIGLTTTLREQEEAMVERVNHHTTNTGTVYRHEIRNMIQEAIYGKEVWRRKLEEERASAMPQSRQEDQGSV